MLLDSKDIQEKRFEYEEETPQHEAGTSLGMIFALLLSLLVVGGTCFGFGYMVGHSKATADLTAQAVQQAAAPLPTAQILPKAAEAAAAPNIPQAEAPAATAAPVTKPSAVVKQVRSAAKASPATTHSPAPARKHSPVQTAAVTHHAVAHHSDIARRPDPFSHLVSNPNYGVDATPSHQPMVQVAVLYTQEDANILLDALKQHGFSASADRGTDNRIHVRLGPFSTRSDASVMREKLLNNGYNAVIQ